jgi:PhnB protein
MLNPNLFFNGNAEDVLAHYRDALDGEIQIIRFAGSPASDSVPANYQNKVLYGALHSPLGTIAAMEAPPGREGTPGSNFAIAVQTESAAQAERAFAKLCDGGTVLAPFEKTFFAERFGMCLDKFGTRWILTYGSAS